MNRPIACELVSWKRFDRLCRELAAMIRADGFRPDLIVAIGRGGYAPARVLSDLLGVNDLTSFKIVHYQGFQRRQAARVHYPLTAEVAGRRVLVVDDVTDSGDTFEVAFGHIRGRGEPAELRSAVLCHKAVSKVAPDYYPWRMVKWRWLVFPWAVVEDLGALVASMEPPPAGVEEAARRLREEHGARVPRGTLEALFEANRRITRPRRGRQSPPAGSAF